MTGLAFDPGVPWVVVAAVAVLAVLAAALAWWRGLAGWAWRGLAGLVAATALAGPVIESGVRRALSDIVILIDDRSASQSLPGRAEQAARAADSMAAQAAALPNTELRRVTLGDDPDGTLLGTALTRALAAEPAGVIAVTDGLAHDAASIPQDAPAPVHVLLTGEAADWDRRLVIESAPAFGLIGHPVTIRLRIEDQGRVPEAVAGQSASLRLSLDGAAPEVVAVPLGMTLELEVVPRHPGQNVVSFALDPPEGGPAQLTDRNDAAVVQIEGVRDRLRVLLVSGEPHAGERTWRNLLKSDPNIDLVHFTILRPPDKLDGVPVDELALIAFPTEALFQDRIGDFDLIIFDRYRIRGILPPEYLDNIRRYVEEGGALLVSGGPEMAGVESLHLSPLGPVLPARPTGRLIERPFLPELTEEGRRHPVTAGLPGAPDPAQPDAPHWGRWLRMAEVTPEPGAQVLLVGERGRPLLVADRVGKGRVALLTSDQVWLWGRGFEGGGPQLDLLRRIAHWDMKEPDLEEESLLAGVGPDLAITVTRQKMGDHAGPVLITGPDGATAELALEPAGPGHFTGRWQSPGPGLYRLQDGDLARMVAVGPAAPREFERTVADAGALAPLVEVTGGSVHRLSDGIPGLRTVRAGRSATGRGVAGDWIGVTPRGAAAVEGLARRALLPDWLWLLLVGGLALAAWLVEGGRLPQGRETRSD